MTQPLGSTWYHLSRYPDDIVERTVIKSTSQTVWWLEKTRYGGDQPRTRQERKGGDWYPTKAEAVAEKKRRLERNLEHANDVYSRAVKALKDFNLKYAGRDGGGEHLAITYDRSRTHRGIEEVAAASAGQAAGG